MSNFYDQFFERGSKGQWPLSPSPTHACEDGEQFRCVDQCPGRRGVKLFGSFKNSFTRKELLVKAKEFGIKSGTVLTWLKRGKDRQFKSDGRGTYTFVHACVGEGDRGH